MIAFRNYEDFQRTLKERIRVDSKRTSKEIVNKVALQVLIGGKGFEGAVKTTRAATLGQLKRDLNKKYHAWTFRGKSKATKVLWLITAKWLTAKGVRFTNWQQWNSFIAEHSQIIFKARNSSRHYLQAGWLMAARMLGARNNTPVKSGGRAAKGKAIRATEGNLKATAFNNAVESKSGVNQSIPYFIASHGLDKAVRNNIKDMEVYIVKKDMEAVLRKHSDK